MYKYLFFLFAFVYSLSASQTKVIEVPSKSMNKSVQVSMVIPDSYDSSGKKYPVVYLLHGYGNNHTNWPKFVTKLVDQYDILAVCPDGARDSWYFDSPKREDYRYETFFCKELIPYIDGNYRTEANRQKRAIAGASMGGHGALYLAMRNKELFGAVAGMSGGLDIRPFHRKYKISTHLGPIAKSKELFEEHTCINNIKHIKNGDLAINIDCGTEDFFIDVNRSFAAELKKQGIEHNYEERKGAHGWKFWRESIVIHMKFFNEFFNAETLKKSE